MAVLLGETALRLREGATSVPRGAESTEGRDLEPPLVGVGELVAGTGLVIRVCDTGDGVELVVRF
jgi:hypothetical protein